jgi:hypothetical protein
MDRKAKARVAIAFDVLQSVDSLKVTNDGWYLADPTGKYYKDQNGEECIDLRDFKGDVKEEATKHLSKLQKCEVCALGACVISQVKLFNKLPMSKLLSGDRPNTREINPNRDMVSKSLSRFFSQEQLNLIETAFEAGGHHLIVANPDPNAVEFGRNYDSPKKRLKAIMGNIIVNDGEFCP